LLEFLAFALLRYFFLHCIAEQPAAQTIIDNRGAPVLHWLPLWRTLHRSITISGVFPKAEISQRGGGMSASPRGMYFEPHGASLDRRRSV